MLVLFVPVPCRGGRGGGGGGGDGVGGGGNDSEGGQGDKGVVLLCRSLVFVGWFFCLWLFVLGCLFAVAC